MGCFGTNIRIIAYLLSIQHPDHWISFPNFLTFFGSFLSILAPGIFPLPIHALLGAEIVFKNLMFFVSKSCRRCFLWTSLNEKVKGGRWKSSVMQSQAVCAVRKQCFCIDSTHNKVEGEGGKMGISQGEGGVWRNKWTQVQSEQVNGARRFQAV